MTIARASATRRAMPPESSAGISSAAPRRPTACSFVSTSRRISRSGRSVCSRSGKATFSNTSRSVSSAPFWNSMPMRRRSAYRAARRTRAHVLAGHLYRAAVGRQLAGDQPQQRGLAGAARAHDGGDPAARNVHVEAGEHRPAVHGIVEIADLDDGGGLIQRICFVYGFRAGVAGAASSRVAKFHAAELSIDAL